MRRVRNRPIDAGESANGTFGYPMGRVGTSDDIAAAAVWLASDECFMTGENLQVNGGLTLRCNPTGEQIAASIARAVAAP